MARLVGRSAGQGARRLITVVATALAVLALGASPALAAPAGPQLSVAGLGPLKASLLATGFAPQAKVDFTVSVGGCVGHASVVAGTDKLIAEFVTAAPCTGVAVATATAGGQTATTTFVFDAPGGTATTASPTAAPAVPDSPGPNGAAGDAAAAGSARTSTGSTGPGSTSTGSTSSGSTSTGSTSSGSTSTGSTGGGADGSASSGAAGSGTVPAPSEAGTQQPGRRTVAPTCTVKAGGGSVPAVKPGDTVCFTGALSGRLDIKASGTPTAPITYSGMGTATVPGVTARGSNIVLEGFISKGANDNGFYVSGNNITVQDNDISQVSITTDDVDAIRFFGDGITIAHNDAHDIWANPQAGGAPHTDCMQTYAHSEPASSNIRIEANRCASPQFHQCLMAEGPHDAEDGASGVGNSANWLIANNYFECHAEAQTVALQDIHNVTFAANDFAGSGAKAIALQKDATGATVTSDNVKGPGYGELVGIDDASAEQGYRGPSN